MNFIKRDIGWGPQSNYKPGGGGVGFVKQYYQNKMNQQNAPNFKTDEEAANGFGDYGTGRN